ncbi:carbohydrate-binding protein [Herpetosiphon gulosus]|uniref:Chitinase A1 n=1 Tax=Herpetosiphon gulosus TaxID=1973496 RepID=A0ABP9X150_9CHLR
MDHTRYASELPNGYVHPRYKVATSQPNGMPTWDGNMRAYKVGDRVNYNGRIYRCLQAHTSLATWTPEAVPALWQAE